MIVFSLNRFRHDFDIADVAINSLHGPQTKGEANRNLQFFFPEERIFVVLKPNLSDQQRCKVTKKNSTIRFLLVSFFCSAQIMDTFRKAGYFVIARKTEKLTAEQVAQLQQTHQGKDYYDELVAYMTRFD